MTCFIRPHCNMLVLKPSDDNFCMLDLFENENIPLPVNLVTQFCGFVFEGAAFEVDDEDCRLYIGKRGDVWVAYITMCEAVTETYLGIVYDSWLVFVDDGELESLETGSGKLIVMELPMVPIVTLAWLSGMEFPKLPGLSHSICRQIRQDPAVKQLFVR